MDPTQKGPFFVAAEIVADLPMQRFAYREPDRIDLLRL
jgi:hypothetical protein